MTCFFFQAEDGIRDHAQSRGLGDVYKRQYQRRVHGRLRASDIHFEPQEKALRIRFRIDGVLHIQTEADAKISSAVALRLKLMSGLDISEKRLPQDGRFNIKAVSYTHLTLPTICSVQISVVAVSLKKKNEKKSYRCDDVSQQVC
eukprot:TRINITY_DN19322_c0_g1_i1.p2 TRINITY_DN19322_c0_g1~~TRINITY_DN19322_c0_g1_i1.p2  ORF type:complete len:145 (-),score=45.17 TRINITY_DN19322_c0_g1_i1:67-501(-)